MCLAENNGHAIRLLFLAVNEHTVYCESVNATVLCGSTLQLMHVQTTMIVGLCDCKIKSQMPVKTCTRMDNANTYMLAHTGEMTISLLENHTTLNGQ